MKKSVYQAKAIISMLFLFISTGLFSQNNISEPWEKYLNERQPPEKVMQAINVMPGMVIGEIGVGRGRYTVYLAGKTGKTGKVLANDIDESSLAYLKGRCRKLGINNVEAIVGEMDDPLFPKSSLDMAIMVLVYHMIENPDNLLRNLKKSLKPGASLVILDPHDALIDREFGIDRSQSGSKVLTIKERIEKSAKAAGYDLVKVETFLPQDYIFILMPQNSPIKQSAENLIQKTLLQDGIEAAKKVFNKIKNDPSQFDLSEKIFLNLGNEFVGSKSYPEAIAMIKMGIELFPKSSKLYGLMGEVYLITGEKENAKTYYRLFLENGKDSLNTKVIMEQFDAMYEQMRSSN